MRAYHTVDTTDANTAFSISISLARTFASHHHFLLIVQQSKDTSMKGESTRTEFLHLHRFDFIHAWDEIDTSLLTFLFSFSFFVFMGQLGYLLRY
ncbi:hypothetical protein BDW59DRAFT_139539 [Aspergillus cavernicola]|uniref:Uncharacterized protein n=1 Tax=Aspergillus cavernicola TaxID=176166 RepID=A0ABR4IXH6_9EURO